ncbi:hypothetical protein HBI56_076130 [Parastagonospora nodorum]|nr:hypothetical protein HBH53_138490 [Parastagonospora nodorum]KAH3983759.1 hypothetical protein HBH52_061460 [Parastagonospora nodorum]KAH3985516.1 hypothetical protein HBH51_020290 [Parastagonospora nodorum]KAH4003785.1 hypothetical protein HBI10_059450 [Parastagonospora nodorum]KAH4028983.1 hypothetical protein HBI13_042910 [Parastagonospora nodorum]
MSYAIVNDKFAPDNAASSNDMADRSTSTVPGIRTKSGALTNNTNDKKPFFLF